MQSQILLKIRLFIGTQKTTEKKVKNNFWKSLKKKKEKTSKFREMKAGKKKEKKKDKDP